MKNTNDRAQPSPTLRRLPLPISPRSLSPILASDLFNHAAVALTDAVLLTEGVVGMVVRRMVESASTVMLAERTIPISPSSSDSIPPPPPSLPPRPPPAPVAGLPAPPPAPRAGPLRNCSRSPSKEFYRAYRGPDHASTRDSHVRTNRAWPRSCARRDTFTWVRVEQAAYLLESGVVGRVPPQGRTAWPAQAFPANKKENRGSPALCVSGNFQENRGCLVLHSGNSRVSLSLRAGLGQNLTQN